MEQTTVRQIVAGDYRTASVFEKYSIDYCCHGNVSLDEACRKNGVPLDEIERELAALAVRNENGSEEYNTWDLDFLAEYIVRTHHRYVRNAIPAIDAHCAKVVMKHGDRHPEVARIHTAFKEVAEEMTRHMAKEELVLFPYIKAMVGQSQNGTPFQQPHFGTIANPIRMMEAEHESAGNAMDAIRSISNGFAPPADACTTFGLTYQELRQFEADLHRHVHLENNILFPKALKLEHDLMDARHNS